MKGKAFIAGLVTGIMVLAQAGVSLAAGVPGFQDVQNTRADYNAIMFLKRTGIVDGYPDGTFKPDQVVNRAESLKMILGIRNFNYWNKAQDAIFGGASVEMPFTDLDKGAWYYDYLQRAYNDSLVNGYPDGTFKPAQTVNTVEALKILLNHTFLRIDKLSETQPAVNPYNDADKTQWYANYVQYAKDKNILVADDKGNIYPGEGVTRGRLAEMIYRTFIADGQTNDSRNISVSLDEGLKKFVVYDLGVKLAELPGTWTSKDEIDAYVKKVTADNAYVSVCATGFGGYILYDFCYGDTYQVNLKTGNAVALNFTDPAAGKKITNFMDVSADETATAWTGNPPNNKIYVQPVTGGSLQSFDVDVKYGQFGDVKFSPDGKKVAYAAIVGNPDNEETAVYIINLADGKQTLVKSATKTVFDVYGWADNDTVLYSTAPQG